MKKIQLACIIDDDPIFVYGTKKMLQLAECCESFMVFNNGKIALDGLEGIIRNGDNLPDVILLDLNMPVMDGWQFLDNFTKIETAKVITIYIVTSSIDPEDMRKAKTYEGIKNYIIKPIALDKIKDLCNGLLC